MRLPLITILIVLLLGLTACIPEPQPEPRRRPFRGNEPSDTVSLGTIVLVETNGCIWCDRQKAVLERMDLDGWDFITVNHATQPETRAQYPASSYPTLYIQHQGEEAKVYTGLQREMQLRQALKK